MNVSKKYPEDIFSEGAFALKDISFNLQTGQTLGLIGGNGAGKSTCIKLLMDFIRPDSGSIYIDAQPVKNSLTRLNLGYLPETASFPVSLTLGDLLEFSRVTCGISKVSFASKCENLIRKLGLWEHRKKRLKKYSKGMQQRANFILALIHEPGLLILDEPMSGLDPIGRGEIMQIISDLKGEGKTILFCSHILDDVDKLADKLLVLHKGQQVFFGATKHFLKEMGEETVTDAYLSMVKNNEVQND